MAASAETDRFRAPAGEPPAALAFRAPAGEAELLRAPDGDDVFDAELALRAPAGDAFFLPSFFSAGTTEEGDSFSGSFAAGAAAEVDASAAGVSAVASGVGRPPRSVSASVGRRCSTRSGGASIASRGPSSSSSGSSAISFFSAMATSANFVEALDISFASTPLSLRNFLSFMNGSLPMRASVR